MPNNTHPASQLVEIMNRIYRNQLTTTSGGNLSMLDDEDHIWITPAGVDKGSLTPGDICCIRQDLTPIGENKHKPSVEAPIHAKIYRNRPDIKALVHAHPPALVAFSLVRRLPCLDVTFASRELGRAGLVPYALPGSTKLGNEIARCFGDGFNLCLMENHGAMVGGADISAAYNAFEAFENTAATQVNAFKLGEIIPLPQVNAYKPRESNPPQQANIPEPDGINLSTKVGTYSPEESSSLLQVSTCKPEGATPFQQVESLLAMGNSHPTPAKLSARQQMISFISRALRQRLFNASIGTYSVKINGDTFLITPHGKSRYLIEESDIVLVQGGRCEAGKMPSQAVLLHRAIYQACPWVGAIAAASPAHAMAFAITDATLDSRIIPESYMMLEDIRRVSWQQLDQPSKIASTITKHSPLLMINNSQILAMGSNLTKAFDRLEVAEATAKMIITARGIGNIKHISQAEVLEIEEAFLQ